MASDLERPLAGIRVIDQADENGEMCGRLLADLGAE
jgi:crotonobetainyl-CoA:carnitine CoA-transferase CaiB-like acyl-CoA transferase